LWIDSGPGRDHCRDRGELSVFLLNNPPFKACPPFMGEGWGETDPKKDVQWTFLGRGQVAKRARLQHEFLPQRDNDEPVGTSAIRHLRSNVHRTFTLQSASLQAGPSL
jgi:hypothetical protein